MNKKGKLVYLQGDATYPQGEGKKIITHLCNNKGGWGRGFVLAINKRWKKPELRYKKFVQEYFDDGKEPKDLLGKIQGVTVEENIIICNMIAQDGYKSNANPVPLKYSALVKCMTNLADLSNANCSSIHCPKFGSGLAGGNWQLIEELIKNIWIDNGIDVYVYEYNG